MKWKVWTAIAVLLFCLSPVAAVAALHPDDPVVAFNPAWDCNWRHGGSVGVCEQKSYYLPQGHAVRRGTYTSAGVMILRNAGCVSPGAVFNFHGAHNFYTGEINSYGNHQMRSALFRFPALVQYLDSVGAFHQLGMTTLTAYDLAQLGVPLCRR